MHSLREDQFCSNILLDLGKPFVEGITSIFWTCFNLFYEKKKKKPYVNTVEKWYLLSLELNFSLDKYFPAITS